MLEIEYTNRFKKDLKLAKRRNRNLDLLGKLIEKIQKQEKIELKYKDHSLSNNWDGHRELHIEPDWLLIYKLIPEENVVIFVRTGTHSDLFD